MSNFWYYARGSSHVGPIEATQLQKMAIAGQLQPSDHVIRAGETQWIQASSVPWLFSSASRPPAASAAPAKTGTPGTRTVLVGMGAIFILLVIAGLATTTIYALEEMFRVHAQLQELQKHPVTVAVPSAKSAESAEDARKERDTARKDLQDANAVIAALKEQLAKPNTGADLDAVNKSLKELNDKLEAARALDAKIIQDLKDRLAKQPISALRNRYKKIDQHALAAPAAAESSLQSLAQYLTMPAANDEEKIRAIFRWITDRISYDADGLFNNTIGDQRAEAVLKARIAVCEGYSNLFKDLCDRSGLEAVKIIGYGAGIDGPPGPNFRSNHAWNTVKLNGQWKLIEATWAAGALNDKKYVKHFNEFYFFTPPELLILNHYPRDSLWQLLNPVVPADTFRKLAEINSQTVQGLIQYGLLKKEQVLEQAKQGKSAGWVRAWNFPEYDITIAAAPLQKELQAGSKLHIKVKAPACPAVTINNNGRFTLLQKQGPFHEGQDVLDAGKTTIGIQLPGKGSGYWTVLEYTVK